jgi:hypothetical protein
LPALQPEFFRARERHSDAPREEQQLCRGGRAIAIRAASLVAAAVVAVDPSGRHRVQRLKHRARQMKVPRESGATARSARELAAFGQRAPSTRTFLSALHVGARGDRVAGVNAHLHDFTCSTVRSPSFTRSAVNLEMADRSPLVCAIGLWPSGGAGAIFSSHEDARANDRGDPRREVPAGKAWGGGGGRVGREVDRSGWVG